MRTFVLAASLAFAVATPALAADPVEGEWLTQDKMGKVLIGPCPDRPNRMCGAISTVNDQTRTTDENNPDPTRRSQPLMGMLILRDFKQEGPGSWTGGKIYDPKNGKSYDSKISIKANGSLKVEGCVAFICRGQTWTRE